MLLVLWIICGLATAAVASAKGRSTLGWLALGVLLGPLALLVAAAMPADDAVRVRGDLLDGRLRRCPDCAEPIRREAAKCRFCGSVVPPPEPFTLGERVFGRRD